MCGIVGFTHFGGGVSDAPVHQAIDRLRHRGPDQQDVFVSPHVTLGAVRLKIVDLDDGDQPMHTEDGDLTVVFNGEIYNHVELRGQLEDLGHHFCSRCDTEVVLRAFAEWDTDCFRRFRGMFAVALWQESQQRLVLARDRMGIKPLYYAIHRANLYFGSELKAIFEHPEVPRRLSPLALGYYLALNYVPGPLTMVAGIKKLPSGSWLEFRQRSKRSDFYWRNRFEAQHFRTESETRKELDELLHRAVGEQLISDVPAGVWLSGGLDSSTILHYAAEASVQPLRTFSVSFSRHRFDEGRCARALARHYGAEHHEFDLDGERHVAEAIHEIVYHSDEPGADAGAIPVWFLSRMTREHAIVALSGEGADELFGGYETYLADEWARLAQRLPAPLLRAALRLTRLLPVSDEKIGLEYKLKRFLAGTLLPPDEAHFFWNGTFSGDEQADLGVAHDRPSLAALCRNLPGVPAAGDAARYLFVDQHYYLPDDILYKCDRMSMAHSVEVRPPFLDHRIVEYAARLPHRMKIRGNRTKYILRSLMRDKLPPAVLRRPKEGFDIPAHEWLRGPLRPLLLETLREEAVREAGIVPPQAVSFLIDRHQSRQANLGYHLWGLLTLHLWMRRWNIQPCEAKEERQCSLRAAVGV